MSAIHSLEALLVRGLRSAVRSMSWRASLKVGERLGDLVRVLGLRRAVAEANLASAFPDLTREARERVLTLHYRQLGKVVCELARLGELVRAGDGEVIAAARGLDHLESVRREGRGAILLSGHFGNFELLGAWLGRLHPVDFVEQSLSNPAVDGIYHQMMVEAGVGTIRLGSAVRRVFSALRENRWVAMLADQDARDDGVFVPFLGRSSSTPIGPAAIAIRTGAPIVMGFSTRRADGRHELDILPPMRPPPRGTPDAIRDLTARHTACLESWIRRHPEMWFWLHRRWKTSPPLGSAQRPGVASPVVVATGPAVRERP